MENQQLTSPFGTTSNDNTNVEPKNNIINSQPEQFQIRTMKDDLASMVNKGHIEEKKIQSSAAPLDLPIEPQKETVEKSNFTTISPLNQCLETTQIEKMETEEIKPIEVNQVAPINNGKGKAVNIIIAIIIILILGIIGLGAYYFFLTQNSNNSNQQPVAQTPSVEQPKQEIPQTTSTEIKTETELLPSPETKPEVVLPKYSNEKPNYLVLDLTVLNAQQIKNEFIEISDEFKNIKTDYPYEFLVVDANNNPVSFPIFAMAAKLNLSEAVLNNLGNEFSVYFYNDQSNSRIGLNVNVTNKTNLAKEFTKQEKTLVNDASFLFLNNVIEVKNAPFADSTYNSYKIRFTNVNANKDLSLDYALTEKNLIVGTSKNTLRLILDKYTGDQKNSQMQSTKSQASVTPDTSNNKSAESQSLSTSTTTRK